MNMVKNLVYFGVYTCIFLGFPDFKDEKTICAPSRETAVFGENPAFSG